MTVAVEENGAGKPGRRIPRRVMLEKLAQQERLAPQPIGARIVGEEIPQLIAKH